MMNKLRKSRGEGTLWLVAVVFSLVNFLGCSDKDLDFSGENGGKYGSEEELSLTYSVFLDQIANTRAEENIDNYIDKKNLQILFFDAEGKFMFKDSNAKMEDSPDKNGQYYVTTSLTNSIVDDNNNSILSLIRNKMETGDFKIVVLANWYEESNTPYSVPWGWNESVFKDADKCKTINDLHHLKKDDEYSKDIYDWVAGSGKEMGLNSNWVRSRDVEIGKGYEFTNPNENAWHLDQDKLNNTTKISKDGNVWIRNNWNPVIDKATANTMEHGIYRHYANLWQLWNFGGGYSDNLVSYADLKANNFIDEWEKRNWTNPQSNENAIGLETWVSNDEFVPGDGTLEGSSGQSSGIDYSIVDGLKVISKTFTSGNNNISQVVRSYKKTYSQTQYCGLILPTMNPSAYEGSIAGKETVKLSSEYAYEYLNFKVPGTGTLRVIFSSLDNNQATLVVQRGTTFEAKFTVPGNTGNDSAPIIREISKSNNQVVDYNNKDAGYLVKITEEAEDINLFCLEGNAVIYAIEYICGDYLSTTDREGIMPSESFPIPMYGVEMFPKIVGWGSSKTINISQNTKIIYLIRALAKVEIYLPVGRNTLTHIYMRSMNQRAWCEPMDVESSTGDLWKLHEEGASDNCEWYRIQAHGSGYSYQGGFKDWLGWFYGSWKNWGWPGVQSLTITDQNVSPQLFNPDIQRADFCHFLRDDNYTDGNMHRYILYVPDKSISDPGNAGDLQSTPKVPHIEYRYANNSDYLDDNDCYRVYFTDYSKNETIKRVKMNGYSAYEKNKDDNGKYNIDQHWPIMRNHIYRFYIGTSNTPQEVRVKVLPWGDADVKKMEW